MTHYPFSALTEDWSDRDVFIVAGGPSLCNADLSSLDGYTIGVNKSSWVASTDALFSLDQTFARKHYKEISEFNGDVYLAMPVNDDQHTPVPGAKYLIRVRGEGFGEDKERIYGVHSGYGALNLAYHCRARSVHLLGYDMSYSKDGKTHHHGGYQWHPRYTERFYKKWAHNFHKAAHLFDEAGIPVINYVGEPESTIGVFEKKPLTELL